MSALKGLPSFSKDAFTNTSPECVYKEVRRIRSRKDPKPDVTTVRDYQATLVRHRPSPEVKSILLIDGVDPKCKHVFKFKSTDFALPFLYSDSTAHSLTSQTRSQKPPRTEAGPSTERKRPVEPRVNVDVAVTPDRKRPRRESERRAEAAERQREQ
ncbi:uncharacterized protein H6S33_005335 [Morchella sextelata]|uniref:uncharacterized protein n=1 Tax=Morchella sextelata TaxID=1174677 RepID=UPI001D04ECC7|nr:uncharacterized protein H6S33_005335 [Morchella sextelata]KAH0613449.1 hypothetical protein H6S33_005335 [Morchella sextelata]